MYKRGFLQVSFPWLFALIVGAVILFLAIYASTKIIQTEQTALDAETAREIGVLLNPLETGFETGTTTSINTVSDTRIHNRCNNDGTFGRQIIRVSQKSFDTWSDTDINVGFSNKYIFSEDYVEGKEFFIFSKPFDFPFKIADLIYLTSSQRGYCFVDAPEDIKNEISNLNQENLFSDCEEAMVTENEVRVCFQSQEDCDIIVNYGSRSVEKNGEFMYFYSDALMYAAIFSDKEVYECQLKRVMQRADVVTSIYNEKAEFVSRESCNSDINSELNELRNLESNFGDSLNLNNYIINLVNNIEAKNNIAECKLF